jgi:hypothetical protein
MGNNKKNTSRADLVATTAEITKVSERYVRYVLDMERTNEVVEDVYMFLAEGKNKLVEEAKKLVPFN